MPSETSNPKPELLNVEGLRTEFVGGQSTVAVEDASFHVGAGEVVGLVGESGSGKSVLVKSLIRILPPNGRVQGRILWLGEDLVQATESRLRSVRGSEISMIFQNPQASLNPARKIGAQMRSLVRYRSGNSKADAMRQVLELLHKVQISDPERVAGLYPFECSGGMCQRILIAMALTGRPKLLIADEPTTSLDVTIQAQIIRLILDLRKELGMSVLFVSHDLGIVGSICDRVAVMYHGRIVETVNAADLFTSPTHPYTRVLIESASTFHVNAPPSPSAF